jgi:SAM-dependent methyltransferase
METDASHWQHTSERYSGGRYMDPALAQHTREVNLELIHRWVPRLSNPRILKTDAFADATCPARAFAWFIQEDAQLVCLDIAPGLCLQGRDNARAAGHGETSYTAGDVRFIPFEDDTFDLIVSDSTLDHFHTTDEIHVALKELARVLKPGGSLIIALDNPQNLTDPLFRLWQRRGRSPYFIGKTLSQRQLVQSLESLGLQVANTTAMLHYPRLVTKRFLRLMRWVTPGRSDMLARKLLNSLNALERCGTRNLTGLFVAARAVKPL